MFCLFVCARPAGRPLAVVGAIVLVLGTWAAATAYAQSLELSGQQVVEMSCVSCHGNGRDGAPRIGDAKAWEKRAAQGANAIAPAAVSAVRTMRAHRGSMDLSDTEIARAIAYMVNLSGGKVAEPGGATAAPGR
jgi:cytochrome c5